jgi:dTMP kinase
LFFKISDYFLEVEMAGKLIVIEGLDGSGKTTQTELLCGKLSKLNMSVKRIKLPNYDDPSSTLVKMYLDGRFGSDPNDVNVYAASSFFAVDRYVSYNSYWKNDYLNGTLILSDRYTTSNAYHQAIKLPPENWAEYLVWLEDYEYNKLGIPKPDIVIYLDMPVAVSQKLMTERYLGDEIKKDIHEKNLGYLNKCSEAAQFACKMLGWKTILCAENGVPLTIEQISDSVYSYILKELKINA